MTDEILFEEKGSIGLVTLNRPDALNALNHGMCVALHEKLDAWKGNDGVKAVVVRAEGGKAFCAGGDVVALAKSGQAYKDGDKASTAWRDFFHDEYLMNAALHHFPKPIVALLDGITMGGGVGISVHGSHRIATENTLLAMPETGIGLFPDVGGGFFLPRLPGEIGMYMALTGARLKAGDCCYFGITQVCVPAKKLDDLVAEFAGTGDLNQYAVDDIIEEYADDPGKDDHAKYTDKIDEIFAADSVEGVMKGLKADDSEWAQKLHEHLGAKSPTSMKVTFKQIREGRKLSFDDEMKAEYRIVNRIMAGHDFYEGVRAQLIDKDKNPKWEPASLADVSDADVDAHFKDLGDDELKL